MQPFRPIVLIGILCLTCIVYATEQEIDLAASDLSLAELFNISVTTASKYAEPIDVAPNVMYVFTKEDIRIYGYHSIMDVLNVLPGFGVFQKDIQLVAQIRGIAPNDNEKITVMVNGHSVNQMMEPDQLNGPINFDNVEKIEILVGPGSVLYGASTLAATINLITINSDQNEFTLAPGFIREKKGSNEPAGSPDNPHPFAATALLGKKIDTDKYFTVSGTFVQKPGWNAFDEKNGPAHRTLTGRQYPSFFIAGQAQLGNWWSQVTSLNTEIPEQYLALYTSNLDARRTDYINAFVAKNTKKWTDPLSTTIEFDWDQKRMLRANLDHLADAWDLFQNSYSGEAAAQFKTEQIYLQGGLQGAYRQNRHNWRGNLAVNPSDSSLNDQGGNGPHTLLGGEPVGSFWNLLIKNVNTKEIGLYLSINWSIMENLKLTTAFRLDNNSIISPTNEIELKNTTFTPRVALIYSPHTWWTTKALFNTATRMPSPIASPQNNLFGKDNNGKLGGVGNITIDSTWTGSWWWYANDNATKPERLYALEWQNIVNLFRTRIMVNTYYQILQDYISFMYPFTNVGDFSGYGVEADVQSALIPDRLKLRVNAGYQTVSFKQVASPVAGTLGSSVTITDGSGALGDTKAPSRNEIDAVPKFRANLMVDARAVDNLHFAPTVRYFTLQPAYNGNLVRDTSSHIDTIPHTNGPDTYLPVKDTTYGAWHYVNNHASVDLSVSYLDIIKYPIGLDARLVIRNLLTSNDLIGAQWGKFSYRPQGITVEAVLTIRCKGL